MKKTLLGAAEPPPFVGLTGSESTIFSVLMNNRAPRTEAFMTALFSTRAVQHYCRRCSGLDNSRRLDLQDAQ